MKERATLTPVIEKELEIFNNYYKESVVCDNPNLQDIINHVLKSDGKKIRPTLLFLAAKACGEVNDTTYNAAITVELLHTASLIHDDVVDESKMRRGKPSLNAIYDNQMAVLVGDYFLSTSLMKSVLTGNIEIINIISNLGRNLAEGELNQLFLAKNAILNEEEYFKVISKKTASLLSACMKIGSISVGAKREDVTRFEELGEKIGICFQMRDDIFDYFNNDVGKPTGNDIREGKVTLPLLYALQTSGTSSEEMLKIIEGNNFTEENIHTLIEFAKENGGIDYAFKRMDEYKQSAISIIDILPENEVKQSLYKMVEYIVNRTY